MAGELTAFATVEDLEARWRDLDTTDEERAEALLLDASNYLRQIAINNNKNLDDLIAEDSTGIYAANVKMVVTNAVQREMTTPTDMAPDATNWTQSATPYSQSMSFGNGNAGTIYFKLKELELLGLGSVSGNKPVSLIRGARGVNL